MAEAEDIGGEKKGRTKARAKARGVVRTNRSEMAARTEDAAAGEGDLAETAKAYSATGKAEAMAEAFNGAAETQEDAKAEAEEQSGTEVKKVDLTENGNVRELGAEQRVPDITPATSFLAMWHAIAAETSDYSRRSFESNYSFLEKLLGATTCGSIGQIAAEHAKMAYVALIAYLTKMTALRAKLAHEFFKAHRDSVHRD
jgi:Phasin protein